jgi:myo-inositol-1(or 4)-monophosphatase
MDGRLKGGHDERGWFGYTRAMNRDIESRLAFAHRLADAAGAAIRPHFRQRIEIAAKTGSSHPGFDPVTEADRGAETAMRMLIRENFPDDGIVGEEYGTTDGESGYVWVLDPLDGTRAFIAGMPMWGTLIALEHDGKPVLGMLDQCWLRERFIGLGGRAELRCADGVTPLQSRECPALAEAIVCTTHPFAHFDDSERALFHRVEAAARMSRYGGDCYAYALVAMGFVDLVMEARLAHWDIAAIVPIVEGAGGVVTDWSGAPVHEGGDVIAAGDKRTHAEALKLIAG